MSAAATIAARRILVVMPHWLGDAVMATPFLAALREIYPRGTGVHIAAMCRPLAAPILAGLPFVDEVNVVEKSSERQAVGWMKSGQFDLGILLPNSFRSAWLLRRAGIPRRLGYARDYRSPLLTDKLAPRKRSASRRASDREKAAAIRRISLELKAPASVKIGSPYEPVPAIAYYLGLAEYLAGRHDFSREMRLGVTAEEQAQADAALALEGISPGENLIVLVPGANFGSSKCWPPERFAQLADRLMDRQGDFNAHVVVASSAAEVAIVDAILATSLLCPNGGGIGRLHATGRMNTGRGLPLGALKALVKRSELMVCNDTGPRHFAAAFGVPAVTLFGPTDPAWAETYSLRETLLRTGPPCSPCQLKRCPIDHRCMRDITVDSVLQAARGLVHRAAPVEEDIDPRTAGDLTF